MGFGLTILDDNTVWSGIPVGWVIDDFTNVNGTALEDHIADNNSAFNGWTSATGTITGNPVDFTTGSETDGPSKVTVAERKITLTAGDRDEDYYVTFDQGAGAITDFEHWVDVNVTAITADNNSSFYFDAMSNADDDLYDIDAANGDCIFLGVGRIDAGYRVGIYNVDGGVLTISTGSTTNTLGNPVYISSSRAGTVLTAEVYSTAALRIAGGAGDVDTITHTVVATAFQFVYGLASYNNAGTAKDISGTVENLWLGVDGAGRHTETLGAERLATGAWTIPAGWADNLDDTYTHTPGTTNSLLNNAAATAGTFYQIITAITTRTAGTISISYGGVDQSPAMGVTTDRYIKAIGNNNLTVWTGTDFDGTVEITVKPITLSSILTLSDLGFVEGRYWLTPGTTISGELVGTVLMANDSVASTDGVFALIDRTAGKLNVFKRVAGTDTSLTSTSITYVDGAKLLTVWDAAEGKMWWFYNNAIVGVATAITDASLINNTWSGYLTTGDASNTKTDYQPLGYGAELVTNGTMEADSDWPDEGTPTTNERSSEQAYAGTYSRKFTTDAGGGDGIKQSSFTTSTGELYRVSVQDYPSDGTALRIRLMRGSDAAAANMDLQLTGLSTGAWTEHGGFAVESAGGSSARIRITDNTALKTSYIDNVSIKKVN